eukprot:COSAG02_NODE_12865_length_1479_cov_62.097826_1_plen_375_part_10
MATVKNYSDVDVAVDKIVSDNASVDAIKNAVKLLGTVISNILKEPQAPKFRSLKKDNKAVATKILPCRGALQLLVAIGFRSAEGVLTLAEERVEEARLNHAQAALASVMEKKAASDASAKQAAAAAKAAQYAEQQRLHREDQLARERERQRMAEQRQELAARRAAEAHRREHVQNVQTTAASAVPRSSSSVEVATVASTSNRRKKAAPKRSAPVTSQPLAASAETAAAAAAAEAAAAEAEAEISQAVKRKQATAMDAAVAEFQQPKKRRRFSPEDAAARIKGTHRSQNKNDASGAYGQVGRNAEASARENAVSERKYAVTEKKIAAANGGGSKLEVVYRLANGKSEAMDTVQKFSRREVSCLLRLSLRTYQCAHC